MRDLNYELAPKPGMLASQRKAELDAARFVSVRNLAYMIYLKPDKTPLMTYQETLDNRELVKTAIINFEISEGLLQNDLGGAAVPQSQAPQMIPQNGAQMAQQPMQPQMSFMPQQAAPQAPQAPMSPAQFAQMPMAPQQQFAPQPPPQQFAPQPQYQAPAQQMAPMQQQMQMPPQQMQMPMGAPPAAPPMEAAPVTGKKRKTAGGTAVAPPPVGQMQAPPGFTPQPVPAQPAAVPVMQFNPPAPAPAQQFQPQFQQPQAMPQQAPAQQMPQQAPPAQVDLSGVIAKIDALGKGVEISANNGDAALKAVAKLQADMDELKLFNKQILTCLHHMYLTHQQLGPATEGKAGKLVDFQAFLQKYIGNPQ